MAKPKKTIAFDRRATRKLGGDEVRPPSLEAIRNAVRDGTYVVDFERLARAMRDKIEG